MTRIGRRRIEMVVVLVIVAASCARAGYEDENRAIIDELPSVDGVELIGESHGTSCSSDSCVVDDRNHALLSYGVERSTQQREEIAELYRRALADWTASIGWGCANADPSFCDEQLFVSFVRNRELITLDFANWETGRFEVYVDARGA